MTVGLGEELDEASEVDLRRCDVDQVSLRPGPDRAVAGGLLADLATSGKDTSQSHDVGRQRRACGRRRMLAPQAFHEFVDGDQSVGRDQQCRQQDALLARTDGEGPAASGHLERAENGVGEFGVH